MIKILFDAAWWTFDIGLRETLCVDLQQSNPNTVIELTHKETGEKKEVFISQLDFQQL